MIRVWTLVIIRVFAIIVGCYLAYRFLYEIRTLLLLIILSIFFCYLIAPLVRLFEQPVYVGSREIRLPRVVAISAVYVLIGAILFFGLRLISPLLWDQLTTLTKNMPGYVGAASRYVDSSLNDANSWMRHLKLPKEWRDSVLSTAGNVGDSLLPWLQSFIAGLLGYLTYLPWLILVPVLSFVMLKDAAVIEQAIVSFMPTERLRKRVHWLLLDVSRTLAAYIRAQLTACLVIWLVVTAALPVIGVPYGVVLGAVAGVLEFVPMVGPLVAAVIICSLALTQSWKTALIAAAFLAVLRIAQDYAIYPRIVGQGIRMHPLIVILAILAGAEVAGLTGIFLGVPIVGLLMVGYNHYLAYRGIQSLEGPEETARQPESVVSDQEPEVPALSPGSGR
jgi:predicted PurR-regulated permease PerM